MSASKKKQQRREAVDIAKVNQAHDEQAAYKKKVRLYTVIGIVAAVLVAALLIWNSGIFQKNTAAATLGEDKISTAELSYYYYDVRQMYSSYGLISSTMDDAATVYNEETGETYQDYFLEMALADAQRYHVLYKDALAHGYSADSVKETVDEEIATLKSYAASSGYNYKSYLKAVFGRYATPSLLENILTKAALASQYYSDTGNETLKSLSEEELEAYYAEHADEVDTITYSYLYFRSETVSSTDDEGNERTEEEIASLKEEALAAAKADAERALEYYNGGMEIEVLISKTAPSSSADHTSVVGTDKISSVYSEELLALEPEQATIVELEGSGYYVVVFHSKARDESLTANVRHILIRAETTTDENGDTVAPTEEAWAAALAKVEEIRTEYESGEMTGEAFAALAEKYSDDTGSNTNGGLYEQVSQGSFVTEFDQWLFEDDRAQGDAELIRHESSGESDQNPYWGYHLTYFEGWDEAEWQLSIRDTTTDTAMDEWIDALCEASPAELTSSATKYIGR